MGPLLMTGLSAFGAAVALGLISTGTWPPDGAPVSRQVPTGRSLAIILMAFCMGVAVLGTVVGLLAIFVAVVLGGILAVVLLASGLRGRKDPIPFGPFLAFGGAAGLFWGERVVQWYLNGFVA